MNDFWVFGYGSLIWRPGFSHLETQKARIYGYRRALCISSHIHRGTPDRPGLVLGLDRGGSCLGMAFRVSGEYYDEVMAYLHARELVTQVYLEKNLPISLQEGQVVQAVTYVVDRNHPQYIGSVDPDYAAARVSGAAGQSGSNEDYVLNTVNHLRSLGICDRWLEQVASRIAV